MQAAYLLFRLHHVMPSDYYKMGIGERLIVHEFIKYEIEQRNKEARAHGEDS